MTERVPRVSVISVNHNGLALLSPLLESLRAQRFDDFEVIVVDNASTDGSCEYIQSAYPDVRLIRSKDNLGFVGGNNLGITHSRGEFVALINNDTEAHPDWLAELVAEADSSPAIGAVASKILFLKPFIPLSLRAETFSPASIQPTADSRDLGVMFDEASCILNCSYKKPVFRRGFYGPEHGHGRTYRWTDEEALVLLPIETSSAGQRLRLVLAGGEMAPGREVQLSIVDHDLAGLRPGQTFEEYTVDIPGDVVERHAVDLLNNAGSFLLADGTTGDRGIYEPDHGQFDESTDISSFCGAAVLLRRSALDQVGLFDRHFFMYYEDTDLAWRLSRKGFKIRYRPQAIVRHHHASTSGEMSPFFVFLVTRNKILMLAKNGRLAPLVRAVNAQTGRLVQLLGRRLRARSATDPRMSAELQARMLVQKSLVRQIPIALLKRCALLTD